MDSIKKWNDLYALCKKCPHSDFYWSVFDHIRTDYGDIRCVSLYSVRMRKSMEQKNSKYGHFSRSDYLCFKILKYTKLKFEFTNLKVTGGKERNRFCAIIKKIKFLNFYNRTLQQWRKISLQEIRTLFRDKIHKNTKNYNSRKIVVTIMEGFNMFSRSGESHLLLLSPSLRVLRN